MEFKETPEFKKFRKNLPDTVVKVGWFEGAKYPDGTSMPMVAATQEFGSTSRKIPARPFMNPTIEEKGKTWLGELENQLVGVFKGAISIEDAFRNIGFKMRDDVVEKIMRITDPKLAPATIMARAKRRFTKGNKSNLKLKKGQSLQERMQELQSGLNKPLIDTGKLIRSIKVKVENKKNGIT